MTEKWSIYAVPSQPTASMRGDACRPLGDDVFGDDEHQCVAG
jgi:hypothetical protein